MEEINTNGKYQEDIKGVNKTVYKNYAKEIDDLSNKINFMEKRMNLMINEKIDIKFEGIGFKEFIINSAKKVIKESTQDIIIKIIKETLNKLKQEIKITNKISRSLCLSIDDDIKNTIRSLDCSYNTDKMVEASIDKHINSIKNKITKELVLEIE